MAGLTLLPLIATVPLAFRSDTFTKDELVVASTLRLAAGRTVLAPEPLAEDLAAAGGRVWLSNPIDAFSSADQAAYLDVWKAGHSSTRALSAVDVVVAPASSPAESLALRAGFSQRAVVRDVVLLERADAMKRDRVSSIAPFRSRPASRWAEPRTPARWWVWPLVIYTTARIINVVMMLVASNAAVDSLSRRSGRRRLLRSDAAPAPAGFLTTVTNWDGQWYWQIATSGYPNDLPRDPSGDVVQNVFAFYPLFPMMSRALMAVTGAGFPVASTLLSFSVRGVSTLLLFRLVSRRSDVLGAADRGRLPVRLHVCARLPHGLHRCARVGARAEP